MSRLLLCFAISASAFATAAPAFADMGCGPSPGYPDAGDQVDATDDGSSDGSGDGSAALQSLGRADVQRGFVSVIPAIVAVSWLARRRRKS